jgi:ATP synthase protein I
MKMTKIHTADQNDLPKEVESLTADQVIELRKHLPILSVWRVVMAQVLLGMLVAWVVWLLSERMAAVYSALYGAFAVIVPAAIFARGLTGKVASANAGAAVVGFFLWEMVKIGLTVAMLFAAPRLVEDLSWPAMLAGLVVTMKVYWVALGFRKVFYPVSPT